MNSRVDQIPSETKLVLVAANPRAGAGSSVTAVGKLVDAIASHGLHAQVITSLDEVAATAAQAQAEGRLRALVAAGGDGTLAELVNRTTDETPLAVFPLGTANLLANYLGLRPDAEAFAAMLAVGKALRLDAGRAAWLKGAPSEPGGAGQGSAREILAPNPLAHYIGANSRIFLTMAGVGFDATVVQRLHQERTGHIRFWSYAKPIGESLRTYRYPTLRYECAPVSAQRAEILLSEEPRPCVASAVPRANGPRSSDGVADKGLELPSPLPASAGQGGRSLETFDAKWLFVHNLPCYAGGLNFTPRAVGTDGLLDICAFERGSFVQGLKYLCKVWLGQHQRLADCRMLRTSSVRITAEQPVAVQLDGDPAGQLPVQIDILPARVRLVVPETALARLIG